MANSQSSAFNPNFIPLTGTDFASGKRDVDLWRMASKGQLPDFTTLLQPPSALKPFGDELSKYAANPAPVDATIRSTKEYLEAFAPYQRQQRIDEAQLSAALSRQQIADLYPFLSAAGAESTARNLAASQKYRAFTEQLPSNVQNIMASKQSQMQAAQTGEAALKQATAIQQDAATRFPGRFAGQYIQVG